MAQKRKAHDAFGRPKTHLSAFAAARLTKQAKQTPALSEPEPEAGDFHERPIAAAVLGDVPYDGHHENGLPSDPEDKPEIVLVAAPPPSTHGSLSSFGPGNGKVTEGDDGSLRLTLRDGESAVCIGEYDVQVQSGIATIYGAVLRPEIGALRVYAPSTYALPRIVARNDGTVVHVAHVKSSLRKLERLSPLFRNILVKSDTPNQSFVLLQTARDDDLQRSLTALDVDKEYDAVLSRVSTEAQSTARLTRIMAVGAKSSGKSTFNRLLCNTLLSKPGARKVLYLDLDPGQPEFGAPGQVCLVEVTAPLLGPPFTHPASAKSRQYRLLRCHAIAATSFKDDPDHYVACARDLIQHVDRQYPLIINSCGWVSGMGASVNLDLASSLDISDMVLLEPLDRMLSQSLQQACQDTVFCRLPRQPPRPSARTPAEARQMQTLAYFHSRYHKVDRGPRWSGTPIADWRPWVISYDGPNVGVCTILSYGQSPNPEFLAEVLDGSMVAITVVDQDNTREAYGLDAYGTRSSSKNDNADDVLESYVHRTIEEVPLLISASQGCSLPLDPRYSVCAGLALVRAVDTERKELHLMTPLAESDVFALMEKHVTLIRGGFDAPEWAYLEDLHDAGRAASERVGRPWVSRREHVGIEGAVWRLRHPPMAADVSR